MPEGHVLHRIARDHTKWFVGQKMQVSSPQGRFQKESKRLSGEKLARVEAFGKHLIYHWRGGQILHVHLGLYGKFHHYKNPPPEPQGAVRVRMIGSRRSYDLKGPNTCQLLSDADFKRLTSRLGPDPLRDDAEPELAWKKISRSRVAIGSLLLNQSVVAGLGNIYRAEILYSLGVHPERPGNQISREEFDQIWELSVRLMQIGVKANRIITTDRRPAGKPASRLSAAERLMIYKHPVCPRCRADIQSWNLGNRTIYACPACQT